MRLRVRSIGVILLKRDVLLQIELESHDVGEEIGFVQRPAQLCVLRAQRSDGCLLRLDLFPRVSQFVAFAQTKPCFVSQISTLLPRRTMRVLSSRTVWT